MDNTKLVQALAKCIEACGICATSCLNEDDVAKMKECIATDLDCADVCSVTLQLLSRKSKHLDAQLTTCITICERCEETCRAHDMEHCQQCAEACKACKEACESFLSVDAR